MIDTPAIEKLLGELEALHEKATPGPYDARNDLIRAIRGDLAIPLFDVREPYEDKAPTVREPDGSVLFRANTQGARTSQAFRRQHANAAYALALLESVPTLITTIRALMEAVEEQKAERALLQDILDSRPAINAGLSQSYVRWSQAIYSGEIFRAAIRSKGDACPSNRPEDS